MSNTPQPYDLMNAKDKVTGKVVEIRVKSFDPLVHDHLDAVNTEPIVEQTEDFADEEVRAKAKVAGIKKWHMKGIKRLKEELAAL